MTPTERAGALARHLAGARARSRYPSQAAMAAAAGLSTRTYAKAESGAAVSPATWAHLEDALAWPSGSATAYLAGAAALPQPAEHVAHPVSGLPPGVEAYLVTRGAATTPERVAELQALVMQVIAAGPDPAA